MGKESKKQIKAQLTNEINAKFSRQLAELRAKNASLIEECVRRRKEVADLKQENMALKEKVEKLEDWNRRLQEFMDMSPDEREKTFKEIQLQSERGRRLDSFMNLFQHLGLYM